MSDNVRVVAVALFNKTQQKYLIVRRGPEQTGAGSWEFPGGKVEKNESDKQALIREIDEELNYQLNPQKLEYVGENTYTYPTKSILLVLYRCEAEIKTFQLSEHDEQQWVSLTEIDRSALAPADVAFIAVLQAIA